MRKLAVIVLAAVTIMSELAWAQTPSIPPEWLNHTRRLAGNEVRFCVDQEGFLKDFERDLAEEIGTALLVKPVIHEYKALFPSRPKDYSLSVAFEDIFLLLNNECDAFMGLSLAGDPVSNWMAISRPIYETPFVLVAAKSAGYGSLGDMPNDAAIGVRLSGVGDLRLNTYLRSLPKEERPKMYQFNNNQMLLDHLLDNTVQAALIWAPALRPLEDEADAANDVVEISTAPFQAPSVTFAIGFLAKNVYLRVAIDDAVKTLIEDGTIDQLLAEHGVSGSAAAE